MAGEQPRKYSEGLSPVGKLNVELMFPAGKYVTQFVREPQLDERLSRHAQSARFPVQGIPHPSREINIHSSWIGTDPPRFTQIKLLHDFLTGIEFLIKCLRFHKSSPLHLETDAQKSAGCFRPAL